jgi:hypothetical protein
MSNSPKSTNSTKSLGERLANVAEKHKKVPLRNSLRTMLNKARATGEIKASALPNYQEVPRFVAGENVCNTTPPAVIKNNRGIFVKNPDYIKWQQKCRAGGKRTTRKARKSRRLTRRRR